MDHRIVLAELILTLIAVIASLLSAIWARAASEDGRVVRQILEALSPIAHSAQHGEQSRAIGSAPEGASGPVLGPAIDSGFLGSHPEDVARDEEDAASQLSLPRRRTTSVSSSPRPTIGASPQASRTRGAKGLGRFESPTRTAPLEEVEVAIDERRTVEIGLVTFPLTRSRSRDDETSVDASMCPPSLVDDGQSDSGRPTTLRARCPPATETGITRAGTK